MLSRLLRLWPVAACLCGLAAASPSAGPSPTPDSEQAERQQAYERLGAEQRRAAEERLAPLGTLLLDSPAFHEALLALARRPGEEDLVVLAWWASREPARREFWESALQALKRQRFNQAELTRRVAELPEAAVQAANAALAAAAAGGDAAAAAGVLAAAPGAHLIALEAAWDAANPRREAARRLLGALFPAEFQAVLDTFDGREFGESEYRYAVHPKQFVPMRPHYFAAQQSYLQFLARFCVPELAAGLAGLDAASFAARRDRTLMLAWVLGTTGEPAAGAAIRALAERLGDETPLAARVMLLTTLSYLRDEWGRDQLLGFYRAALAERAERLLIRERESIELLLASLGREDEAVRRLARDELARRLGRAVDFDPAAAPAVRQAQQEALAAAWRAERPEPRISAEDLRLVRDVLRYRFACDPDRPEGSATPAAGE